MKSNYKAFVAILIIVLAFTVMALLPMPVQAQGFNAPAVQSTDGITSGQLFAWLIGSGGLIVILSWLVERWTWYQAQNPDWKKVLFITGVVILGSIVHALQLYVPAATWAVIDPWFQFISGLIIMGAGAMGLHQLSKPGA